MYRCAGEVSSIIRGGCGRSGDNSWLGPRSGAPCNGPAAGVTIRLVLAARNLGEDRRMDGGDQRVAVVMITYNRREEALRTLVRLTALPEKPRIVVVDNGSSDGTAAAVAERFPEVEVLPA